MKTVFICLALTTIMTPLAYAGDEYLGEPLKNSSGQLIEVGNVNDAELLCERNNGRLLTAREFLDKDNPHWDDPFKSELEAQSWMGDRRDYLDVLNRDGTRDSIRPPYSLSDNDERPIPKTWDWHNVFWTYSSSLGSYYHPDRQGPISYLDGISRISVNLARHRVRCMIKRITSNNPNDKTPPCRIMSQHADVGSRCVTTGFVQWPNEVGPYEATSVQRVADPGTGELGWKDEKSGNIYLDFNSDSKNSNTSFFKTARYCQSKSKGQFKQIKPSTDDVYNLEKHGLREILRDMDQRTFWTSTGYEGPGYWPFVFGDGGYWTRPADTESIDTRCMIRTNPKEVETEKKIWESQGGYS